MTQEARINGNCSGEGCTSIWKILIDPKKEKDGELALFLKDSLFNIPVYISSHHDIRVPLIAREEYMKRLKIHVGHLMEYLETGNIKDCPRRGY